MEPTAVRYASGGGSRSPLAIQTAFAAGARGVQVVTESDYRSAIEGARLGAEWAWTLLYRDVSPAVLRYLRAHGAREPEDLLGDVFVQVVRALSGFQGGQREFHAWVFTIARNRLTDDWRRRGRKPDAVPIDELPARDSHSTGDAEDEVMRRLADQRVYSIIARLSEQQRDVVFLRVFGRLTVVEVAQVLGKSPGAIKALQTRAFAAIRREVRKNP